MSKQRGSCAEVLLFRWKFSEIWPPASSVRQAGPYAILFYGAESKQEAIPRSIKTVYFCGGDSIPEPEPEKKVLQTVSADL